MIFASLLQLGVVASLIGLPGGLSAPTSKTTTKLRENLKYNGINIAGFEFGCNNGNCSSKDAVPPLLKYHGQDGAGQMKHFVKDDGFNAFRLPVGWQFLTNDRETATLEHANFAKYNDLVQACLDAGADRCILSLHNFARFNGGVIGQGGPSNEMFAKLWGNIAKKYALESRITFGIMNEPHAMPSIPDWADTVQAAVTAIRKAGAKSQIILLPGDDWDSAETFVSGGSADALAKVTNPDGSTKNLIMEVHKYFDADNSGSTTSCVGNNIDIAWAPLADWLRKNNRLAWNTETGAGNTDICVEYMCQQIAFQKANSDVFLGYLGWAAGSWNATTYPLSEVPIHNADGSWTDQKLVAECLSLNANATSDKMES